MNLKYTELMRTLNALPVDITARSKVMAAGVALAVASTLPLPSSAVISPDEFFNLQVSGLVNAPLSDINENCILDMKQAVEFTRQFWMLRYAMVFPGSQYTFAENSPYGFFDTILGVNLYVGPAGHEFMNLNKDAIYKVTRTTLQLMKEYCAGVLNAA